MNTVSGKSRIEKRLRMFAVALCFCRIGNLFSNIKKFKKIATPIDLFMGGYDRIYTSI